MYRACDLKKNITNEYGVGISYHKIWWGKELDMQRMYGEEKHSFDKLGWYQEAVLKINPGSYFDLDNDSESSRFKRMLLSFHASIVGFELGCRPLLFIDRTF